MPNSNLPGYTSPMGEKLLLCFDHTGPTSYTRIAGTAPNFTGGDLINASDLSVGGFDFCQTDMTDVTGQFYAFVVPINGGNANAVPTIQVIWYARTTATIGGQAQTAGNEVATGTNLSTFSIRVQAWCV